MHHYDIRETHMRRDKICPSLESLHFKKYTDGETACQNIRYLSRNFNIFIVNEDVKRSHRKFAFTMATWPIYLLDSLASWGLLDELQRNMTNVTKHNTKSLPCSHLYSLTELQNAKIHFWYERINGGGENRNCRKSLRLLMLRNIYRFWLQKLGQILLHLFSY